MLNGRLEGSDELRKWVDDNLGVAGIALDDASRDHITMCLTHLVEWSDDGRPLGHFLSAVARNDLLSAGLYADDTNRKVLFLYSMFCYWFLPIGYVERARKKDEER
jgi:hypothetical protein